MAFSGTDEDVVLDQDALQKAAIRETSPTRELFELRNEAQIKINKMAQTGLPVFNPEWNKGGIAVDANGDVCKAVTLKSTSFSECTLKLFGTDTTLTIPVQTCTTVGMVRKALADKAMVSPDQMTFVVKQGCSWQIQNDSAQIARRVVVRGLKSFSAQAYKYPHPIVFLGAGYNCIRYALSWVQAGNTRDFQMYERYDKVGGHAWLVQANKTSKLQTDMATFHIWFGIEYAVNNQYGLNYPVEWDNWPKKDQIIQHMQHCAEHAGLLPHIRFRHNCKDVQVVGKLTDFDRYYVLPIQNLDKPDEPAEHVSASAIFHTPGAYFNPRIIIYPGEDTFGGQIGHGMMDDIPFDYLWGNTTAILGNGAFAVENIRTACEYGAKKVYVVTRKKNLPSTRFTCWFVHQSIIPVPAAMLLNTLKPAMEACGMGDPWDYHSVYAIKDRAKANITSNSRFGIGDVTLLAVATGRCEYVQDITKRMTYHCLHMTSDGRKLEDVSVIIKCLGLIADFEADRMHKIKEMTGYWPSYDYRRCIYSDPLGMSASNFASFSTGPGSYNQAATYQFFMDWPQEWAKLGAEGILDLLPKQKSDEERPAHQYSAKYMSSTGMVIGANTPRMLAVTAGQDIYFAKCVLACLPRDKMMKECIESWNQYQLDWWRDGFEFDYVPYPYTEELIDGWFEEYKNTVGPTDPAEMENYQKIMEAQAETGPTRWDMPGSGEYWMAELTKQEKLTY